MRHLNYWIGWLLLCAMGCPGLLQAQGDKTPKLPEVSLAITFERGAVEIGDSIPLVIQLSNASTTQITHLQLVMNGPAFVSLRHAANTAGDSIYLGELTPLSGVNRNGLRLVVSKNALVGDFNLLFTLAYTWRDQGMVYRNQVTAEKPLRIGLLGTDKIIGIPLAFAQFIVPGLFFLSLLGLLKVPVVQALDTQEKLVFSVLISVLCLFLVNYIGSTSGWGFARQLYQGNTISIEKLFYLALIGVVLGGLFWTGYVLRRRYLRIKKEKLTFREDEKPLELVQKALQLNKRYEGHPWKFTCKDGRVYYSAHYFESELSYVLVAAFKIPKDSLRPEQLRYIEKYCTNGQLQQTGKSLLKVLDYTDRANPIPLRVRNPVKREEAGELVDESIFLVIGKDEFRSKQHVVLEHMKLIVLD